MADSETTPAGEAKRYRVLARAYRPQNFADLIGQDALVRTLTNAIESGRIAQAYILTGVRGVGKTTTARILAKALNYRGADGKAGPTAGPTDDCAICQAIAEDRHVDVMEMDAASRTGVGDIRELIESVRYRPIEARYKVYIVDEVHMLSTSAFNALLKTLEEPPPHVVFIFATTEIRKVPVTVLSRCQRFDLRRVDQSLLVQHFTKIAEKEGVTAEAEAIALIARAADGSVRDGLSLLDQAIALGGARVETEAVRAMLGIADRGRVYDLLDALMDARLAEALEIFGALHAGGVDPVLVLQDLMEVVHSATRAKLVSDAHGAVTASSSEQERLQTLVERLSLPELARAWQILLKGHGETQGTVLPRQAAEMVLIRLACASDLPTPGDLVKQLTKEGAAGNGQTAPLRAPSASPAPAPGASAQTAGAAALDLEAAPRHRPEAQAARQPIEATVAVASFPALVSLARSQGEQRLANHLECDVSLVAFGPRRLSLYLLESAPGDLMTRLAQRLPAWTGQQWSIERAEAPGDAPLRNQRQAAEAAEQERALRTPLAQALLDAFPEARLVAHHKAAPAEAVAEAAAPLDLPLPEDGEAADYFDPDELAMLAGMAGDSSDED